MPPDDSPRKGRRDRQVIILLQRQLDHRKPEVLDLFDDFCELLEVDRLGNVAVRVQVVHVDDVLVRIRSRQHHDGNRTEIGVLLDFRKDFAAVLARHVEIEQDQVRPRRIDKFACLFR